MMAKSAPVLLDAVPDYQIRQEHDERDEKPRFGVSSIACKEVLS
jgi:hypothetical protein